jgi:hypothetical protein
MDNLENNLPTQPEGEPLPTQYDSLRQLVLSILVLLIVISGTFNIFLLRQARTSRQELDAFRVQVTAMTAQYQKNVAPAIEEFVRKLGEFGRSHPDFMPILNRHLPTPANPGPAPAAPANVNKK